MKLRKIFLIAIVSMMPGAMIAAPALQLQKVNAKGASNAHMGAPLEINGTGSSSTFTVNPSNLSDRITLQATSGFEVYPTVIPATAENVNVRVTLRSTLPYATGMVILRSGDFRAEVPLVGHGSALEQKALDKSTGYAGTDTDWSANTAAGFKPGENGYTVEFRVKMNQNYDSFNAYGVTPNGGSFRAYVEPEAMGLFNSASKIGFENPLRDATGGKKKFYNNDGKFHTYRYAVTSDRRVFVYRDGVQVATLRADDYGHQADWAVKNGEVVENLLKNGNFEGEWNQRSSDSLVNRVEGWIVDPIDQYNCKYEVPNFEINNELDHYNHVMKLQRYNWNDGWAAGTVSQIVNVAPGSTYSLSFLAKGGMDKKSGTNMTSVKIEEVQDAKKGNSVTITNEDDMQEYGLSYTTSAECNQIKVILYNERFLNGGGWGSSPQAAYFDEMVLSGMSRNLDELVGFDKSGAEVEYFTYDVTGAYAPLMADIIPAQEYLTFENAGQTRSIKVDLSNLPEGEKVKVSATAGFSVYPEEIASSGEVRVTLNSTLPETAGRLIMRCGDLRRYVELSGSNAGLEEKDIREGAQYADSNEGSLEHYESDGFKTGDAGYTIEFRAKINGMSANVDAYASTKDDAGFKAYVEPETIGLYNGTSKVSIANPSTDAAGGKKVFYNNDGKYHTYRYAVTPDKRVKVYRDGIEVANLRTADYGHQAEWAISNGEMTENLLKNPGFEGEFNYRSSDNLLNRVEGWTVDPIDTYNCNYDVQNREINNDIDHDNHVMMLKRYNWNDGWGAGTVSQIVDVAPGKTYSLSFLAMGGRDNKSGTSMSSMKIQEVQNSSLGTSVTITNDDDMEEYGMSYTPSAECSQIKVIMYNERFLNGGGWGSSPQPTYYDNLVLSGMSRVLDQKVGFGANGADVEYFAYDVTGAYAPKAPGFGGNISGVENMAGGCEVRVVTTGAGLKVYNVSENAEVRIYDAYGMAVATVRDYVPGDEISLPSRGIYVCKVSDGGKVSSSKLIY